MSTLRIMRGLPGSGKTTAALAWVAEDPKRRVRIGRDPIRQALHGRYIGEPWAQQQVTEVQRGAITAALEVGYDVVVDDTNLPNWTVDRLKGYAAQVPGGGVTVEIWDMRDVSLAVCMARNDGRPEAERVPDEWIHRAHLEHIVPWYQEIAANLAPQEASRG